MEITNASANALLQQFKLENEWDADVISLNNFYVHVLEHNESLSAKQKAAVMQDVCLIVDAERDKMENLAVWLLEYHRVCGNCNALHAPEYYTYGDLFCRMCGNSLCVPAAAMLDLYMARGPPNANVLFDEFLDKMHCAYCHYKSTA
ncbi:ORF43 peptide [Hyphantria cunea nucleopolyhedrovirus]|uniref:ORF43 peptide n=1 Tax=Hyphantria cunea nuclear polyhedrosis virus TaxID=28288 RepID=Q2NNU6_NPVHC|nr:ORF43 peptide [Hyphantria cunea nucleopolyhedrovirus]BAE72332.1 ORF43 peptide [Hyphantria cunea nucleopolyhedrovirus]